MYKQLHKNFTVGQVKSLLKSYLNKKIKISYILQMLKIKRSRFFELLAKYRKEPDNFSIQYARKTINRKIDPDIERNIVKELKVEKDLIKNKKAPLRESIQLQIVPDRESGLSEVRFWHKSDTTGHPVRLPSRRRWAGISPWPDPSPQSIAGRTFLTAPALTVSVCAMAAPARPARRVRA